MSALSNRARPFGSWLFCLPIVVRQSWLSSFTNSSPTSVETSRLCLRAFARAEGEEARPDKRTSWAVASTRTPQRPSDVPCGQPPSALTGTKLSYTEQPLRSLIEQYIISHVRVLNVGWTPYHSRIAATDPNTVTPLSTSLSGPSPDVRSFATAQSIVFID